MSLATKSLTTTNIRKSLLLSTTAVALCGMLTVTHPREAQAVDLFETPTGGSVAEGNATISKSGFANRKMDVEQTSKRAIIDWQTFNIGQGAHVNFDQTQGSSSIAVNRIGGGAGDPSRILGRLTANGRLVIIDPNGVIFESTSRVDVGGLIASTGDLADPSGFMDGDNTFNLVDTDQHGDTKAIVNKGYVSAKNKGLVAFVAPYVENRGIINARLGKVDLAAGQKATIDLMGDKLVSLTLNKKLEKALVENSGLINAPGGQVTLSSNAAKNVVDNVINMDGVIKANSFSSKGGKIILNGTKYGTVKVAGKMEAQSGLNTAGSIDIDGKTIELTNEAVLDVRNMLDLFNGSDTGSINIGMGQNANKARYVTIAAGAELLAQSAFYGDGGDISIWAKTRTLFNGMASIQGGLFGGDSGSLYVGNGGDKLGYDGTLNLLSRFGTNGDLTLEAKRLYLVGADPSYTGQYVVRADKIAKVLSQGDVSLTGKKLISTRGDADIDFRSMQKKWPWSSPTLVSQKGDLSLTSERLKINKDNNIIMNDGQLNLFTDQIDLNAKILGNDGNQLALSQLKSTTGLVRVVSNRASIQQGIDLLNDVVINVDPELRVEYGKYKENLLVNKSITMNGLNRSGKAPVLTADDTRNPVVKVAAHDVTFNNFDVQASLEASESGGYAQGLTVWGFKGLKITDSAFTGFYEGVRVASSENTYISNSIFTNNDTGLKLADSPLFDKGHISETPESGDDVPAGISGFATEGAYNGDITLADNNFVNNRTGAYFESGVITLDGVNTFTGGETGMIFSPAFFSEPERGFDESVSSMHSSDEAGVSSPYGSATLELTGNTLGETVFEGQTGNYITLENGALFNPGTPTVINGIDSTFDGVSGPELTTAQLNRIEGKIRDYDDKRTLGQIFVGFVPEDDAIIDQEDVLRQINDLLGIEGNSASVRVTGLPRVPGLTQNLVNMLNAITPAAGGDGDTPEELDALQPAAGGNDNQATCWSQVGNSISRSGGGVSYSLGENPQDILSDMAGCDT